ncbi:hypothetical protein PRIPAC_96860 [Pristionchus pacificus]|uniref:Uncharacterized protein n=1 Tax=Pristionchus pacificus TaxID=54126 RepID=A0A2A6BXP4_PRIPA|nr:hypothetical protein PRIPAC_96860 [Pristionchus pacificus]|eukprot:PDM70649.1 hypothetical protein PRIPAC_43854 [Pristionchus pacificus]
MFLNASSSSSSLHSLSQQQFQVHTLNIKVKEHLRFRRLRMNRQPNVQFTIKNGKPEPIPINNITIPTTSNSTNPKDDSSPLMSILPLSGLLIMLILFICYLLPYVSFRNRGSCCGRCCCCRHRSSRSANLTVSNNISTTTDTSASNDRGSRFSWIFEQLRWIRRERNNVQTFTRTRESSVRFSSRLKKITYSANGDTHFQEIRCLDGDDIAEEVSIHVAESENDDQDTTVYGDLGRPKTFSDASACSYEIPEVIVHRAPLSDSSAHLHPYRTMSTKSHESRKKIVRPLSYTLSAGIDPPAVTVDARSAWSDPNLAASMV